MIATGEAWPDLAGRLEDTGHVLPVRVYFEDTDFSGVVYHGAFVRFLERGRSDFLRLLGVGHDALAGGRYGRRLAFAVKRMTLDFRQTARIDEVVEVRTKVGRLTGARVHLIQSVERDGDVLVEAGVEVVMLDDGGRPRRLPAAVHDGFRASFTH